MGQPQLKRVPVFVVRYAKMRLVILLKASKKNTVPSGKRLHNYGKSPCLLGKSTISGNVQQLFWHNQRVTRRNPVNCYGPHGGHRSNSHQKPEMEPDPSVTEPQLLLQWMTSSVQAIFCGGVGTVVILKQNIPSGKRYITMENHHVQLVNWL